MDNAVNDIVARNSSLAKPAAKTMSSKMNHILAAVSTHMGLADWCSNSQTHGNTDSVIRQTKPRKEIPGAFSQAPDSLELAANSLALDSWSPHAERMASNRQSSTKKGG